MAVSSGCTTIFGCRVIKRPVVVTLISSLENVAQVKKHTTANNMMCKVRCRYGGIGRSSISSASAKKSAIGPSEFDFDLDFDFEFDLDLGFEVGADFDFDLAVKNSFTSDSSVGSTTVDKLNYARAILNACPHQINVLDASPKYCAR